MHPDQEEIHQQQILLAQHRRMLSILLRQQSQQGGESLAAPAIIAGIYEARQSIRHIKEILRSWGETVEDRPDDERFSPKWPTIFPGSHQLPLEPHHYIPRKDANNGCTIEESLHQALLNSDEQPLIVVHGISGTGKSSLVSHVVRQLEVVDFAEGILWGDLANSIPNDQILTFLGVLDNRWYSASTRKDASLRDVLWRTLIDKRVLIVLDNVKDARQLIELLPPEPKSASHCRVLAISLHPLHDALLPVGCTLELNAFGELEALELFRRYMGEEPFKLYEVRLREISKRLEYLPQLLATAAHDFTTGKVSPNAYAQMLRQSNFQSTLLGNAAMEGLEFAFRDLTPEQMDLIELIGIFGEGDWRDAMLATVALRSLVHVRQMLSSLVDRALIHAVGDHRYRANSLVREFAQGRFRKQSDFRHQAAYTLLAHYCLDMGQDLEATLLARPDLRSLPGQPVEPADEPFIKAFREGLMPEMSHIRAALRWAVEREAWDILRRFSYLPYMELLKHFLATGFEIRMSLSLATLLEPVIRKPKDRLQLQIRTLISSTEWSVRAPSDVGKARTQSVSVTNLSITDDGSSAPMENCELELDITAGNIIDGVFQSMSLVNARWIAVRARGLICCHIDIVGGEFLACDLSQSVWVQCDARRVTLHSTNLSYALLRDVKLRGADLQGAILTGAVLEQVDLRDANMRGVNLVGALLDHVDLRGADLHGANLTAADVRHVNLIGAQVDQVRWAGAKIHDICVYVEDPSFLKEISLAAQVPPNKIAERVRRRERCVAELAEGTENNASKADLRGAPLDGLNLERSRLNEADMRAAMCKQAILIRAKLSQADLRGADLSSANLTAAVLRGADLKAAMLSSAVLVDADMSDAILRFACLDNANLSGADLRGADLRDANLNAANLSGANLEGVRFANSFLEGANLTRAHLRRAFLDQTLLSGADLSAAELTDTTCTESNLINTIMTSAHLSGTFSDTTFASADMRQAVLSGDFVTVNLSAANLSGAHLSGTFSHVDLSSARLSDAHITGVFSWADLSSANLESANLENASFVNADLRGAIVSEAELRAAQRLRGTLMLDGRLYDGRFNLAGDLSDAQEMGYDLTDSDDRTVFYQRGRVRPKHL